MKKWLPLLIALVIFSVLPAGIVLAIAEPDPPSQINAVYVYDFDDGSVGVLIDYTIEYVSPPTETATDAFFLSFVDTDGATPLKTVAPYSSSTTNGYDRGVAWIPFTSTEVADYGINSANENDYRIWLLGNPALSWTPGPDPPKTVGFIGPWNTTGDMEVLLALDVLRIGNLLNDVWGVTLVESTSDGNKLTTTYGEPYFENAITSLRTLAPACFASTTTVPEGVEVDYSTAFSATAASGTATVTGSPVTLTRGTTTITVTGTGTVVLTLGSYVTGNISDNTGTLSSSPLDLRPGTNTATVSVAGTFDVALTVDDLASSANATVSGTGLDVEPTATLFGLSRWLVSGVTWILLSIVAVTALFRRTGGSGKVAMLIFAVMLLSGTLLGLLHPLIVAILFIAYGAFIGYVLFFQSDALHKGFMFMMWMFLVVSLAGNVAASQQSGMTTTRLTVDITATETDSIEVISTAGFPDYGVIYIGDERILYPDKDDTHFLDTIINDIVRGSGGTDAEVHSAGDSVRTPESYMFNASIDYKVATLVDSAGALQFIAAPLRLLDIVVSFFILPLTFLGTEMAILSYVWMIVAVGMVVGFVVTLVGGRRVG